MSWFRCEAWLMAMVIGWFSLCHAAEQDPANTREAEKPEQADLGLSPAHHPVVADEEWYMRLEIPVKALGVKIKSAEFVAQAQFREPTWLKTIQRKLEELGISTDEYCAKSHHSYFVHSDLSGLFMDAVASSTPWETVSLYCTSSVTALPTLVASKELTQTALGAQAPDVRRTSFLAGTRESKRKRKRDGSDVNFATRTETLEFSSRRLMQEENPFVPLRLTLEDIRETNGPNSVVLDVAGLLLLSTAIESLTQLESVDVYLVMNGGHVLLDTSVEALPARDGDTHIPYRFKASHSGIDMVTVDVGGGSSRAIDSVELPIVDAQWDSR